MKMVLVSPSPQRWSQCRQLLPGHELVTMHPDEFMAHPLIPSWDLLLMDAGLTNMKEHDYQPLLARLKSLDGLIAACPDPASCLLRHDGLGGIQFKCGSGQQKSHAVRTLIFQDSQPVRQSE